LARSRRARAGRRIAPPRRLISPLPLARADLPADTLSLARFLIGKILVRELPSTASNGGSGASRQLLVRIIETEAYPPNDPASHAFRGETPRNRAMYLERGFAYVYFIYGSSYCLNVASEKPGIGAAVLVRAGEALAGRDEIARLRGGDSGRDLLRGPGRLCAGLAVDRTLDGIDLCSGAGALRLACGEASAEIGASPRIGLTRAPEPAWRFFERGNPLVSGRRPS
jgi:DNA-3-methyladenine glycosylase